MKKYSCIGCGAPLNSNKCEYCGREYDDYRKPRIYSEKDQCVDDKYVTLNVYGEKIDFYVSSIDCEPICKRVEYLNGKTEYIQSFSEPIIRVNLVSAGRHKELDNTD